MPPFQSLSPLYKQLFSDFYDHGLLFSIQELNNGIMIYVLLYVQLLSLRIKCIKIIHVLHNSLFLFFDGIPLCEYVTICLIFSCLWPYKLFIDWEYYVQSYSKLSYTCLYVSVSFVSSFQIIIHFICLSCYTALD